MIFDSFIETVKAKKGEIDLDLRLILSKTF